MATAQRVLAIDYGTVRVGLAVGWAGFAEPLEVVANDGKLFESLLRVIKEQQPELIVVGLSEKEMAEQSRAFAEKLKTFLADKLGELPTFDFADETLSSVEVNEKLRQAGKSSRKQGAIDHLAAAQFLQEYLDLHQSDQSQ